MMAVWTPGSYLIREYSRNVESVTASGQGGRALAIEKSDPAATETSSASGTAG